MKYESNEFLALMEEVERQGGAFHAERCEPTKFTLKIPDTEGNMKFRDIFTTGCNQESRFVLPYEPEPDSGRNQGFLSVCAVDDEVGRWPRFIKALKEAA